MVSPSPDSLPGRPGQTDHTGPDRHDSRRSIARFHDDTAPTPDGAAPRGRDGDLPTRLVDQIEFHMREQVRPRLEGLTDEGDLYDPIGDGDTWAVHPRAPEGGTAPTSIQGGSGEMVIDFEFPEPDPAPFTTIAWRLGHVIVGVLAVRSHSGRPGRGPPGQGKRLTIGSAGPRRMSR
ncbi:hypothetical protein AB0I31_14125 [Brachybacterium paraconglomeratum]